MTDGVTIRQAAAFGGVTIKTVRHYHKHGLLDEPQRDSSGYRRYGSADLLRLVQVRTLAAAGVPLAEIGPMLDADPATFAAALEDVKLRLTRQIEELTTRRDTLDRLADGDRALLGDRAVALLDRARGLGMSPDELALTREGWVLAKALVPDGFDDYLTAVEKAFEGPDPFELNQYYRQAEGLEPDDPRVTEIATEVSARMLANPRMLKIVTALQAPTETAARYRLIAQFGQHESPALVRVVELVEAQLRAAGVRIPRPESP